VAEDVGQNRKSTAACIIEEWHLISGLMPLHFHLLKFGILETSVKYAGSFSGTSPCSSEHISPIGNKRQISEIIFLNAKLYHLSHHSKQ